MMILFETTLSRKNFSAYIILLGSSDSHILYCLRTHQDVYILYLHPHGVY